ncbi:protocatechuate 3,4-dioxygenase beta subunit [Rhodococcus wratislaviensis]|uniref:Catechol 1,2-dioxygenase n=1 Tax=Rhodococcus wratislaviensis TaxID=44752 RepID=A0AB38FJR0_RHOWR|nr:dioxygenase [Rhodococcus wratislaviensis]REE74593.1 protocatechuate 3,4-dioxygenase beta subunit [Rhodococcus wratislaviensis]SPZ41870.1 catechol 1,2-dioxygenase [Rhodococcus wratislaviensis]
MTNSPRQHADEVHEHDRGLSHDLKSMLSRRRALFVFGAAGATALAACSTAGSTATSSSSSTGADATTAETVSDGTCVAAAPQETAGPYPGDGSNGPNVLVESGIVRQDIRSSFGAYSGTAEGVATTIELRLQDLTKDCAAGAGMAVYLWHCDRDGEYSLYGQGITEQNYLRGVQVADSAGTVSFTSIFPACYSGRWPHIHFEVFDSLESAVAGEDARLTSQIAVPQDACTTVFAYDSGYANSVGNLSKVSLDSDNVFGDGWDAELATVTGEPATGMTISITIGVAEKSANTQSAPSGPGGGGGQPPAGAPGR